MSKSKKTPKKLLDELLGAFLFLGGVDQILNSQVKQVSLRPITNTQFYCLVIIHCFTKERGYCSRSEYRKGGKKELISPLSMDRACIRLFNCDYIERWKEDDGVFGYYYRTTPSGEALVNTVLYYWVEKLRNVLAVLPELGDQVGIKVKDLPSSEAVLSSLGSVRLVPKRGARFVASGLSPVLGTTETKPGKGKRAANKASSKDSIPGLPSSITDLNQHLADSDNGNSTEKSGFTFIDID